MIFAKIKHYIVENFFKLSFLSLNFSLGDEFMQKQTIDQKINQLLNEMDYGELVDFKSKLEYGLQLLQGEDVLEKQSFEELVDKINEELKIRKLN